MRKLFLILAVPMVGLFLAGCSGKNSNNTPAPTNSANANSANYLSTLAQAEKYSQNKIDTASLNQAIQQFNVAEGRYPKNLQELVPNYIAKIPQAPVGYKINYDQKSGAVSIVKQ